MRLLDTLATIDGDDPRLDPLHEAAVRDTIERFGATGSPVISDGEQRKYHNFWTYCVHGMPNLDAEGFKIPIAAGRTRRMPQAIRRHRLCIGVRPNHGNVCYAPASLAIVSGTSIGMSSSSCAMPLPSGSRRCEAGPPPSSAS